MTEMATRTTKAEVISLVRDPVIDVVRGFAITAMVVWHSVMLFSETRNCHLQTCGNLAKPVWWATVYVGSFLSVPLFYLAAGMTLAFNLEHGKGRRIARRALLVITAGYAFSAFVGGWRHILDVQVLQSIGAGILLMQVFSRFRRGWLLLYAVSMGVTAVNAGGKSVHVPEYSSLAMFPSYLLDGMQALLLDGNFPLLAWGGFMALGYGMRRVIGNPWSVRTRVALGTVLMFASFGDKVSKYPMSLGYLLLFSGLCLVIIASLDSVAVDLRIWCSSRRLGRIWVGISRHSLEIYLGHFVIGILATRTFPEFKIPIGGGLLVGVLAMLVIGLLLSPSRATWHLRATDPNP